MFTGNLNTEKRQEVKAFAIYSHELKDKKRMSSPLTELFADEDGMDVLFAEEDLQHTVSGTETVCFL
ncbi:MAG: hypothetical protein ACOYN6_12730 [Ignavibacteria bacterium]|jgi:hypothetical protein